MGVTAGSQFFYCVGPIFFGRSFRTTPGGPERIRECRDFIVPKCGDAMAGRSRLRMPMRLFRVLEGLPRLLVSRQVLLLPVLLGGPMGVGGDVVQFGGPLVVFVM